MKTLPVSFNEALEQSVKKYWNRNALSDYGEITFQYKDAARIIAKLHILFEETGIKKGDKIAMSAFGAGFVSGALVVEW